MRTRICRVAGLKTLHLSLPAQEAGFAADVLEALGNHPPLTRFCVDFGGASVEQIPTFLPQVAWLRSLRALQISGLEVSSLFLFGCGLISFTNLALCLLVPFHLPPCFTWTSVHAASHHQLQRIANSKTLME